MKKESPVKKFPGHVIMPDFLTMPQVRAFEDCLDGIGKLDYGNEDRIWVSVVSEKRLPVILDCVKEWHIEGVPEKPDLGSFPMTPAVAANEFVGWLFGLIRELWIGEEESPNA